MTACVGLSQTAVAVAGYLSMEPWGITGAALFSISGGLASAALLFVFGFLEMEYRAREMSLFGGLSRSLPQASGVLILASLSLVGIPGLGGFAGLYPTLGSIFDVSWASAFLAVASTLLVAWALFWMLQRIVFGNVRLPPPLSQTSTVQSDTFTVFQSWDKFGPVQGAFADIVAGTGAADPAESDSGASQLEIDATAEPRHFDLRTAELCVLAPLLVGLVLVGLRPQWMLDLMLLVQPP